MIVSAGGNGAEREGTDVFLHDRWVVSMEERRGEPAQVEVDVAFCCFHVPLVGHVHRFAPVSTQGDPDQTWAQLKTS